MHEDGRAQERRHTTIPRTGQYASTSDAIFNFLIIIFPIVYAIIQKWLKKTHTPTKICPSMCIWEKCLWQIFSLLLRRESALKRYRENFHPKCIRTRRWFGSRSAHITHCSRLPLRERKRRKLLNQWRANEKIAQTTHQCYRHVIHRRYPRCRHRIRPLIPWLPLRGVHDEVLAVDQSDWALFSIWAQSLPLQHITQATQLFSIIFVHAQSDEFTFQCFLVFFNYFRFVFIYSKIHYIICLTLDFLLCVLVSVHLLHAHHCTLTTKHCIGAPPIDLKYNL